MIISHWILGGQIQWLLGGGHAQGLMSGDGGWVVSNIDRTTIGREVVNVQCQVIKIIV